MEIKLPEMPKRANYSNNFDYWEDMGKYFEEKREYIRQVKNKIVKYIEKLNNKSPFEIGPVFTKIEEDIEEKEEFWIFEDRGNFNISHKCIKLIDITI